MAALAVEPAERLVEDHQPGVPSEPRAGEAHALPLAAGYERAALAERRLQPLRKPPDYAAERRRLDRVAEARRAWRGATLLCVTHDLGETEGFDRVLVVEDGGIAEDGAPAALAARAGSRYAALLAAETAVRARFARGPGWRRLWLEDGRLEEMG